MHIDEDHVGWQPRCLQHDAAASLLAARATVARSAVRGGHRRGQMDGAATPLGERDPLGLPLTPSEGWTLPEGAQVQCPRGMLASKGVTGTYSATGFGALVRSSAASLRDDGRLESSCWARGTSSVRIPVGYEGSAVGRVAEGREPFALRSDFCATTRNVFPRPPTRSTAARARIIC